ncbi:hypothetical protein NXH76_29495 [Blautia schinkii]|nr:hypothetical protein [Blautia schinkii]
MGWSKFDNINYNYCKYKNMFVDREEILLLFKDEYLKLKSNPNYFKVISIYGIGGIGKSYLIEKLLLIPQEDNFNSKIITINMDIMHSADIFDNLVKVRKQIETSCLYFDYALILLWDVYKIEKLDESFMRIIKGGFLDLLNMIDSGLSSNFPTLGIENVLNVFRNNVLPIIQKKAMKAEVFEEINNRFKKSPQQLYEFMPHLLGMDLAQITKNHRLIAFFDSYERYIVDHDDWLKELIGSIEHGLFIVASREKLDWTDNEEELYPYKLCELPVSQAELVLKSSLSPEHYKVIDSIINKTQCVPIFLELAINIYKKLVKEHPEEITSEFWLIKDKSDFIKRFLHHLPESDQEIVLILSVIRIFNADIFEWIVHDLNLNCSVLKYYDICKLCLINLLKEDDKFLKLHDVFTQNALNFIPSPKKQRILHSYISYIGKRGLTVLSKKQLTILFRNLLFISDNIIYTVMDIEYLCDIFFVLYESNCSPELYEWIKKTKTLLPFRSFIDILYTEKIDAKKSYEMSLKFALSEELGKHKKSFMLIQNYALAISGNYEEFARLTKYMYYKLETSDVLRWYYGKTKIYYGDHLMLHGDFVQALLVFEEYKQELENFPQKKGDSFEVRKQAAHCKRFNMLLDEADSIYQELAEEYVGTKGLLIYVLTNICETNCYFKPDVVFKTAQEAIKLSEDLNRPKEKAKILYSLAIANLHNKNYNASSFCIKKSIALNQQAHYPSGILFALMAQAFLDYAQYKKISRCTKKGINGLLKKGLVYQFFEFPISIMECDFEKQKQLKNQYNWIDFSYTLIQYQKFIWSIS